MKTRGTLLLTLAAGGLFTAFAAGTSLVLAEEDDRSAWSNWSLMATSSDDDEDEASRGHENKSSHEYEGRRGGHGDDDRDEGDDDDDDDDDEGHGRGDRNAPARAGTAAPPDNGLILKGTSPKVQVN